MNDTPCIENYQLWELLNARDRSPFFDERCELDKAIAAQAERAGGKKVSHMSFLMPNGTRLYLMDQAGWQTTR